MAGTKGKLNVIKTEYFDLIFPIESEETALKLQMVCDEYYEELCRKFEYEPYQRFTVSITKQVEISNAFFSLAPYNLIVIYDYKADYEINNSEKDIEAVFYHELTHAVSLNSKSPFWRGMSWFANICTPAGVSLTSFWYEGAAVAFESLENGGRLNDPFFNQKIIDAKIKDITGEKKFPSWRDVTGTKDIYPYGNDAYVFGSHFARFLIKTYGLSKYAQFWKNAGSSTSLSFCAGVFKKTYGKKLSEVWKEFYESIYTGKIDLNKRKAFVAKNNLISKKGSVVTTVDSYFNEKTKVYDIVWFDTLSSALYLNSKKLFSVNNVESVRFSDDGKSLLIKRLVDRSNIKVECFTYDLKTKRREKITYSEDDFDECHGLKILKEGLDWKLVYTDKKQGNTYSWDFGNRILRSIHFVKENQDEISFVFTYAKMKTDSFARVGLICINKNTLDAEIKLQNADNCGGIIETVPYENGFAVISEEYYSNPLRKLSINADDFTTFAAQKITGDEKKEDSQENFSKEKIDNILSENKYKKYNPFDYWFKGVKLPVGTVPVFNHELEDVGSATLGVTFISSNPWTDKISQWSLGFDPFNKNGGAFFSINGGDDNFSYDLYSSLIFDSNGFEQSYGKTDISQVLWQGYYSYFLFGTQGVVLYGKDGIETEIKVHKMGPPPFVTSDYYKNKGLTVNAQPYVYFSTIHRTAPGYNQYTGFYIKPFIDIEYQRLEYTMQKENITYKTDEPYYNAGASFAYKFPGLFPALFSFSLFPQKGYFAITNASLQLASFDIQKGIPAVSLYAQRLLFNLMYAGGFEYKNQEKWDIKRSKEIVDSLNSEDYVDYVQLSTEIQLSLNTSYFANSDSAGLGAYARYFFNGTDKNTWKAGLYINIAW